jgi:hypothetical protein
VRQYLTRNVVNQLSDLDYQGLRRFWNWPQRCHDTQQALDLFRSDDLIGIGMEADAVRRRLHPEGVATYIIDRNINYTTLHRILHFLRVLPPAGTRRRVRAGEGTIWRRFAKPSSWGPGVLMQGWLHPELKIEWYEDCCGRSRNASRFICIASLRPKFSTSPK